MGILLKHSTEENNSSAITLHNSFSQSTFSTAYQCIGKVPKVMSAIKFGTTLLPFSMVWMQFA